MSILLDTCVISELIKPAPDPVVLAWTGNTPEGTCFLSTITLIAATALVHGLKVATRNIADFRPFEVEIVDPWTSKRLSPKT